MKYRELKAELNSTSAILRTKEAAAQVQEQMVAALRGALQIKATEMSHSYGQDIKTSLLMCLAKVGVIYLYIRAGPKLSSRPQNSILIVNQASS